jgi:hypothetical protein
MKCAIILMDFQRFDAGTLCKQNELQKNYGIVMCNQ